MRLRVTWLQMLGGAIVFIIFLCSSIQFLSFRQRRQWLSPNRKYSVGHNYIKNAESGEHLAAKEFKVDDETLQMIEKIHREQTFKRRPVKTNRRKSAIFRSRCSCHWSFKQSLRRVPTTHFNFRKTISRYKSDFL